jgi:hypothetical protein
LGAVVTLLDAMQDAQARAVRILEALYDGDLGFVELALDDLAADLRRVIEEQERP